MATSALETAHIAFEPIDNRRLANLCGQLNEHLKYIEQFFNIEILQRGNEFKLIGPGNEVKQARHLINLLYEQTNMNDELTIEDLDNNLKKIRNPERHVAAIKTRLKTIKPLSENQQKYVNAVRNNIVNFAIGPAGCGKTYLAVASALEALDSGRVKRLVFVRPAIEAGEKLGYLPGDLEEKILPYLKPLYDALYEFIGVEGVEKLLSKNVIEIAPLAFMRGRTLNDAFVILDEAQNTTSEQMKMFLTRMGYHSKLVICGDITQIDLPSHVGSGLKEALDLFHNHEDISITFLNAKDTSRHPLLRKIITTYESKK